jgi:hypothetical protein
VGLLLERKKTMRKLLITAVALSGIATAMPALAQGYPGAVPQTDVPAKQVYGENHGGWLTALIRGEFSGSTVAHNGQPQQSNVAAAQDQRATN